MGIEHDVAGLDVTMNHAQRLVALHRGTVVGCIQSVCDLGGDFQSNAHRDALAAAGEVLDEVPEVDRLQIFHHDGRAAIQAGEVIDVDDVPVPKEAEQARLVTDASPDLFTVGPLCVQEFDGDHARKAIGVFFLGQVDRPKASGGNGSDKSELATSFRHRRHPVNGQGSTRNPT